MSSCGGRPCRCAGLARLWVETTRNFGGVEEGKELQAALAKGLPQLVAERWDQQGEVAARSTDEQLDVQALSRAHATNASARSGGQALWVLNSLSAELSRQQLLKWAGARTRLTAAIAIASRPAPLESSADRAAQWRCHCAPDR